ncbi:hypothetical protein AGMMS50230_16570 [Spirochaetia bacterium]|nr:hypothetical protein AGMMS50230_16570 [Spirochaetia bacterium]
MVSLLVLYLLAFEELQKQYTVYPSDYQFKCVFKTTECAITDIPEKKDPPPMPGGGMGGMGGMDY